MKQVFSNSWKASKQVRKQRKYRANAPLHIASKMMGSHLSKELRKKHIMRSVSIRKGDGIKVMRGKFKGKTGKISQVDIKKQRVAIEGLQNKKKDGTKINVFFDPSNLLIQTLNEDDKRRFKRMKLKVKTEGKKAKTIESAKTDKEKSGEASGESKNEKVSENKLEDSKLKKGTKERLK